MNITPYSWHTEDIPTKETMVSYYERGVNNFKTMSSLLEIKVTGDDNIEDWEDQVADIRNFTISNLINSLNFTGNWSEQRIKIKALLLLAVIHDEESEVLIREDFFYRAVEIAQQYLHDDLNSESLWTSIIETYIAYIDTTFGSIFPGTYIPSLSALLLTKIIAESNLRIQVRLEKAADTNKYISIQDSSDAVIAKLEKIFGPIRIIIVSEVSSEILICHRCLDVDVDFLQNTSGYVRSTTVNIFDIPRKYSMMIDRGSDEFMSQFKDSHLQHIIYPILDLFIEKKEYEFFIYASDNSDTVEVLERASDLPLELNDYSALFSSVIAQCLDPLEFHESTSNIDYIDHCIKAIDICRVINFKQSSSEDILQIIDDILWGRINRDILYRVQSILLSCNETMNGIGYPFGLSKKDIPLEWRIFSIIRAYEALCLVKNQFQVLTALQEWAKGWYFDTDILRVFIENIKSGIDKKIRLPITIIEPNTVSSYRRWKYTNYMHSWSEIQETMLDIEDNYHQFRKAEWDKKTQNIIIKQTNELCLKLRKQANSRKLIIITRHGSTESDIFGWPPGDDNEFLTKEWEEGSHTKWLLFQWVQFRIFSSPLLRARQTSAIICQKIRNCTRNIVPINGIITSCMNCPWVIPEFSIGNPKKNMDNWRYNSYAQKIFADNASWLMEFLIKVVSSSQESQNLFIAHRDSGRHMIFWLKNLFSQDGVYGEKTKIDNDTVYEFFFKWDHIIEWWESKNRGLLFSIFNWKDALFELNGLIWDIFWEEFYLFGSWSADLIWIHDRFLDFFDRIIEDSPEKVGIFILKLSDGIHTKHFINILKSEGFHF